MESRTPGQIEATGTLPVVGEGTLSSVVQGAESGARQGERPAWVDEARASLEAPGKYLAYEESGKQVVVPVSREWTRIGRSLAADVRFDDATVSRRHALIVAQADGVRVLDDRSLNGVYVNGRRVEWSPLGDGDEIVVGRHTIYFLDAAAVESAPMAPAAVAE
ncbi:MAG TPA: FHA domain-containing protein [Solirubrobacteraceae bacterium]|nr:FHA domain-containing protein [Solirubrobacteraceae bacterium]